mmetsp:Transcript_22144/g.43170  ORF Transcript_22144/g.43170 Transcript_22144/m.43170 type:complete len:455 (-) Transcript_22144:797-2161(-)
MGCKRRTQERHPLPEALDVLIIGAGPHGLAMASRLLLGDEAMADVIPPIESYVRKPKDVRAHLKKVRRSDSTKLAVVDAGGVWMERWQNQFKALGIEYLRSHEMMHPDAFDHSTLSVWAHAKKRSDFLFLEKLPKNHEYCGPFVLPSSRMMLDFCKDLVKLGRLEDNLWQARADAIQPCESGMTVTLTTADGTQSLCAKHVVIARGPTWRRQWPCFYRNLEETALAEIHHAWDLFDMPDKIDKLRGRGVIVGGGLTSAHLCAQLAPRGHIDLVIRRQRREKQYDLELSWMGPNRRGLRREYEQASVDQRAAINKEVRDGGSMTPELSSVVSALEARGLVTVHEWIEVATASFDDYWTVVLSSDEVIEADYLICATGALMDIATDPLLAGLQEAFPLPMQNGLPILTENLQWGKLPVYLMGNLAALELGPDAVNMTGAARGAQRISSALAKSSTA